MGFRHLDRSPRRPYGRRPRSHPLVEDMGYWGMRYTPYWWTFPEYRALDRERERERTWREGDLDGGGSPRTKAVPMPHGGVRYLFRCPLCNRWRQHLYNMTALSFLCRRCLGLRYKSQYIGRRVDASRERLQAARMVLERAEASIQQQQQKEADRRERRAASARLRRQQATWRARRQRFERAERDYEERRDDAYMRGLVRIAVWCDRQDKRIQRLVARLSSDGSKQHEVA
jgi:hypothetical protein